MDVEMKDSEVAGNSAHAEKETLTVVVNERARLTLDSLPDNVLHKIGMHIAPKHLKKLSMVNKRLHDVLIDSNFKCKYYLKNYTCPFKKALSWNEPRYEVYELIYKNATKLSQLWTVDSQSSKILCGSPILPRQGTYRRIKVKDRQKIIELLNSIGSLFAALHDLYYQMEAFMKFDDLNLTAEDADLKLSRLKATISAMLEQVKHIPDAKFEIISEVQRFFMFDFKQATEGLLEGENEGRLLSFFNYLYGFEVCLPIEQAMKLQKALLKQCSERFLDVCLKSRLFAFLVFYGPSYKELITDSNFIEGICCSATSGQLNCVSFYLFDYLSTGDINIRVEKLAESIVQVYASNAETSKNFPNTVLFIESMLPKVFRYYFWQRIWAKLSSLNVKRLQSHRTAFLLAVCFFMKEMDARSIAYDYDGAEELIERHFASFLEGKDVFSRLDSILALGFSCGISSSSMAKMCWDKATSYTSMRRALKFCMTFGLDTLQEVIDRALMNKCSLDYMFSLVNAASYYIEDMEPVLAVLKNILFDYGLSETFYDFVRTGNIDFYAFVPEDIFDNDLGIVGALDSSDWAEAFERLRSKADNGKYASLLDLKDQKQAYESSRDHDGSDSHGYGYGYYHGYYHDYGYYDSDYEYY